MADLLLIGSWPPNSQTAVLNAVSSLAPVEYIRGMFVATYYSSLINVFGFVYWFVYITKLLDSLTIQIIDYLAIGPRGQMDNGCSENEDPENEDRRQKIQKTKTKNENPNSKTARKSKEITCFSSYWSLVAFLSK